MAIVLVIYYCCIITYVKIQQLKMAAILILLPDLQFLLVSAAMGVLLDVSSAGMDQMRLEGLPSRRLPHTAGPSLLPPRASLGASVLQEGLSTSLQAPPHKLATDCIPWVCQDTQMEAANLKTWPCKSLHIPAILYWPNNFLGPALIQGKGSKKPTSQKKLQRICGHL